MYSETDIEAAIASGALTAEAAQALRDSVAARRESPAVDEESFRLLTGFNDIFVSIAAILLLVAVGWIGATLAGVVIDSTIGHPDPNQDWHWSTDESFRLLRYFGASALGAGAAVAATSWLLAEYFTRRRRMALPSILLLATFTFATGAALAGLFQIVSPDDRAEGIAIRTALAALLTAGAAYLHWRRFQVPITVAALTGALVMTVVNIAFAAIPGARDAWLWVLLVSGLAVFAFAMSWDMLDRARTTRRSDVAFWLHLAAAPMIAHPIFNLIGVLGGEIAPLKALLVLALYGVFGIVALAIDRRALLVSSLVYVLFALAELFRQFGAVGLNVALTALVIGSALLLLSAFWHPIRRRIVEQLPADLQARLPYLDRAIPLPA
jgi:hypothetical protein